MIDTTQPTSHAILIAEIARVRIQRDDLLEAAEMALRHLSTGEGFRAIVEWKLIQAINAVTD